ncbi:hypothetical protein CRM22_001077 [Opisthorchis felineus]|uniref:Fe2OG dioxygenase domain-containing protein n=1 Tax=Opisthorchis felineus TaxID=147828 RepID=A0A4S2MC89_OPIFE|nr:hypothetical protein CRM22_001077 [Opisthorchis felineus]
MSLASERTSLCGCKGIRKCKVCQPNKPLTYENLPRFESTFCSECALCYQGSHRCHGSPACGEFTFHGISVVSNFVTEEEEAWLLDQIDQNPWALSQSGRRKQDYGPKVNFKRQRVVPGCFTGLPSYSRFLVDRINQTIRTSPVRQTFIPVELCNLEYCPERGASIVPHLDDVWLWGDRLVTLSLCSSTTLIFTLPNSGSTEVLAEFERIRSDLGQQAEITSSSDVAVRVPLPPRSLVIVVGPARYVWHHSIRSADIQSRRIAMTFRELSKQFVPQTSISEPEQCSEDQLVGRRLLQIAQTFHGAVCTAH